MLSRMRAVEDVTPVIHWQNQYPKGSPTHGQVQYAFKTFALKEAERQGHDVLMWCDAAMYPMRNVAPMFEHIEREGYLLFENVGHPLGVWTSDRCLDAMGMSRAEAHTTRQIMGCCVGIDLRTDVGRAMLDQWHVRACDGGVTFNGPHYGICADDETVKGHRHDQSVLSILAARMGLSMVRMPNLLSYGETNASEQTCMVSEGM